MGGAHSVPVPGSCSLAGMSRPAPLADRTFDSLSAMMQAYAAEAVRIAAEDHGLDLDYTPASVARLETVLAARGPVHEEEQQEATRLWGAWFGEIFRRRYDGEWIMAVYPTQPGAVQQGAGEEMAMPALDIRGSHVYPLLKVFRRITLGPAEDLSGFYARVTAALDANAGRSSGDL